MRSSNPGPPAIAALGVSRRFPGVVANDCVSLEVQQGEVHGLVGENGSGKTTLCRILAGYHAPDSGSVELDGVAVHFASPKDAHRAGVFMVEQHFSLVERATVAENVALGFSDAHRVWHSPKRLERTIDAAAREFGIGLDVTARVSDLQVGQRQRVEILKALYRAARVLILDEPTAVLTPQEADNLFTHLRRLAEVGHSIVIVTHKLREVLDVCDAVTVLRRGKRVDSLSLTAGNVDTRKLSNMIIGSDVMPDVRRERAHISKARVVLDVEDVSVRREGSGHDLEHVSFKIGTGEILGVAGVVGNGQQALTDAIAGLSSLENGRVTVNGRGLKSGDPRSAVANRVAYVPEDRYSVALAPGLSVEENIAFRRPPGVSFSWGPFVRRRAIKRYARDLLVRFDVRGNPEDLVRQLSGGNAQRVLLARELASNPQVLIVAEPCRGLDVLATQMVRRMLSRAAAEGCAVLLVSEDLDELLELSDRIAVLCGGRLMGVVEQSGASREQLGLMMTGIGGVHD